MGRLACNVRASAAATVQEARKILVTQGWERAWVDGVTERISRKQIACSPQDMEDVVRCFWHPFAVLRFYVSGGFLQHGQGSLSLHARHLASTQVIWSPDGVRADCGTSCSIIHLLQQTDHQGWRMRRCIWQPVDTAHVGSSIENVHHQFTACLGHFYPAWRAWMLACAVLAVCAHC